MAHTIKPNEMVQITCGICLEDYTTDSLSVAGKCGHCFHTKCLEKWFTGSYLTCPQCRARTTRKNSTRLYLNSSVVQLDDDDSMASSFEIARLRNQNEQYIQRIWHLLLDLNSVNGELDMADEENRRLRDELDRLREPTDEEAQEASLYLYISLLTVMLLVLIAVAQEPEKDNTER